MVLWFVAPACLVVWAVFRDARIDFRLVALGALLPGLADIPVGHPAYGHTLLAAVAGLVVVVATTIGRRPIRKRLIMVPIGMLLHLALEGVFSEPELFWWPIQGTDFPERDLFPSVTVIAIRETVGLVAALWFTSRFGLGDAGRRRRFLRTGHVEVGA